MNVRRLLYRQDDIVDHYLRMLYEWPVNCGTIIVLYLVESEHSVRVHALESLKSAAAALVEKSTKNSRGTTRIVLLYNAISQ